MRICDSLLINNKNPGQRREQNVASMLYADVWCVKNYLVFIQTIWLIYQIICTLK